jgi:hypothetical protein
MSSYRVFRHLPPATYHLSFPAPCTRLPAPEVGEEEGGRIPLLTGRHFKSVVGLQSSVVWKYPINYHAAKDIFILLELSMLSPYFRKKILTNKDLTPMTCLPPPVPFAPRPPFMRPSPRKGGERRKSIPLLTGALLQRSQPLPGLAIIFNAVSIPLLTGLLLQQYPQGPLWDNDLRAHLISLNKSVVGRLEIPYQLSRCKRHLHHSRIEYAVPLFQRRRF